MPKGRAHREYGLLDKRRKKGGVRRYKETGEEYESDEEPIMRQELYDIRKTDFLSRNNMSDLDDDLLSFSTAYPDLHKNTDEGMNERNQFLYENIIRPSQYTNVEKNEAGYINEIHFGNTILHSKFKITYIGPTIDKFIARTDSNEGYYAPADFIGDNYAIEIKTVFQGKYEDPIFWCPVQKIDRILELKKKYNYIYWAIVGYPEDVIENRNHFIGYWCFYNLKRFKNDLARGYISSKVRTFDGEDQNTYIFSYNIVNQMSSGLVESDLEDYNN
jgi:hypothetical protein